MTIFTNVKRKSGMQPTLAHIKPDSPRAKVWREVLGGETAPIKGPVTCRVEIIGHGMNDAYLLDLEKLNPQQKSRLVVHLSTTFKIEPDEVRAQLHLDGTVPILADDVSVTFDGRLLS